MRQIKFRAWDGEEMVEVAELHLNTKELLVDDEEWLSMRHSPLMQYTGLRDKNGREIYEGDIIKYHLTREYGENYDPITLGFIGSDWSVDADIFGEVRIWPSNGVMMTQIVTDDPEMFDKEHPVPNRWHVNQECEVIGNIYENPELLEASK
ncbi:YopX family protein [Lacticaseibacillus absianus]|uniref:YopX family protein n=1 Tax=Lacticaseibacillus absianus TaxID=2729623 RepID=UPI0015CB40E8|nr:YopX family protein [Lacticaseibacillus absianus]